MIDGDIFGRINALSDEEEGLWQHAGDGHGLTAEEHKYPMPDKSHARNAKARASQQEEKGTITAKEKAKIDRKADRILDS